MRSIITVMSVQDKRGGGGIKAIWLSKDVVGALVMGVVTFAFGP